jgi:hypothetical protein
MGARRAAGAQPDSAWIRLRHKLSEGAEQAKADASVGLATLGAVYFKRCVQFGLV